MRLREVGLRSEEERSSTRREDQVTEAVRTEHRGAGQPQGTQPGLAGGGIHCGQWGVGNSDGGGRATDSADQGGAAYKRGVEYEVADGTRIANEGEKTFNAYTAGGAIRTITAQICGVNKPLLSVRKIVESGNRVVFEPNGSFIEDCQTKERMKLDVTGGMYMLKVWVKGNEATDF